jgi:DMSO/TMAO reductase YedYZ molybdopterin-dependent catalytic subunit
MPHRGAPPEPSAGQVSRAPGCRQDRAYAVSRRSLLGLATLGLAGSAAARTSFGQGAGGPVGNFADDRALIVRSQRPLNLESPIAALDQPLTPNALFFVRSHFGAPAVDLGPWLIDVAGLVDRPLRLGLDELMGFEHVQRRAVLQCAGNGRALFRPRVPGVPWERGAVGQAEWSGVRLADLLERAGLQAGAAHVHFIGGDGPPSPRTPAFIRSIPLDRAREPGTIVATEMNGEPLPVVHGGPLRLVIPGWAGNNWLKWIRRIVVAREEAPGFYMQTAYRLPRTTAKGANAPNLGPLDPLAWLNVKSLITWPRAGSVLPAQPVEIRGLAWTGRGQVDKVEVAAESGGAWQSAALIGEAEPGAWRLWRMTWQPKESRRYVLAARATDSLGDSQLETPAWNRSGYLWNGIDTVTCEIR